MFNWRTIGFYVLPLLLAVAVMAGVRFKTDISAFIVAGDNAEEILLASEMQSGALSRRYLIAVDAKPPQAAIPEAFMQTLKSQLKAIDGVTDVWSPEDHAETSETLLALYGPHASAWYSLDPKHDLAGLFSGQGLQGRAELLKKALLSPQSTLVKKIAAQDPLLLSLAAFKTQGLAMQQAGKASGAYRNLILETAMPGLDAPQQKRIQTAINKAFNRINHTNQVLAAHYQLSMTGVPVFAVTTQTLIQGDIQVVSLLSTIGLLALFLLVFRSSHALLQVSGILFVAILTAILATQAVFGYVHGMTVAIGSTLVGICIDYPIHAIAHAQTVKPEHRLPTIAKIWPSMVLGGITTLIGYMALGASGYPGFKQVAVFAASGIIASLLLTRFVLPGLVKNQTNKPLNVPFVGQWAVFCQRFRPVLLGVLAVISVASLFGLSSLHWMTDMQELTPELNYLKQNDQRIRGRMTSIEPGRFVLVADKTIEAALQRSEAVYKVLDQLKHSHHLDGYYPLYPWVLSQRQQQLNQTVLQGYLNPENLVRWRQALTQQGLSVEKLGHFNYPQSSAMTFEQVLAAPVKKLLDNRVIQSKDQTLIMIWLAGHHPEAVKAALVKMEGVQYFSQRDVLNTMTRDFTERAQQLLSAGLVLIILLLMARYKSPLKTAQTLLPAVLSAVIVLGFWSSTGVAISFLHLVGFLLVVAICVDYGIFYQENRGGDSVLTYQAMGAAMLTSALAFACLMVSESTSLKILSGVVVMGVVLGYLLCPIIIKPKRPSAT
ncbi:MAG: MMPL family transporter [Methylovulum sp.]|uniref:MMPL family transporter n=1 Tax=Methylovulum sp. TaxID=1916980 RepID=UPI00262464D7|nr:MMPL family transporter [Methylovulum sp.]MDD2724163.1 MMPL family transporter [Methylovulum sp.]MDD5123195.1 MMPL family transporter [Methylovulum sp.]